MAVNDSKRASPRWWTIWRKSGACRTKEEFTIGDRVEWYFEGDPSLFDDGTPNFMVLWKGLIQDYGHGPFLVEKVLGEKYPQILTLSGGIEVMEDWNSSFFRKVLNR